MVVSVSKTHIVEGLFGTAGGHGEAHVAPVTRYQTETKSQQQTDINSGIFKQ